MHSRLQKVAMDLANVDEIKAIILEGFTKATRKIWLDRNKPGLVDFGTVFVVPDDCHDIFLEATLRDSEGLPVFVCPETWRMPQLVKALGAFDSASQASKNGWNRDIPTGYEEHPVRISHTKGCITTFKLPLLGMEMVEENGEFFHREKPCR